MKTRVIAIAALALLAAGSLTGCTSTRTKAAGAKRPVSAICPVMKNRIPDVARAAGKSVYKGKTYYFCCPGCKPLFDKNPGKYAGR